MGDKIARLHNLFEGTSNSNSKIIYSDGIKKISVRFNEVQEHVCFIQDFLKNLNLTGMTVCILTEQGLALPAIILGILKADSAFAFLDVYKPFESLSAYQQYEHIKTLIVQEGYVKDLESKLCCCWKKTGQFYVFSEYILLQSFDCRNDACPNSNVYGNCEMHSEIAYIIQTSGTTGEPKIVKVPHRCIIPNIIDFRHRFSVTVDDVILQSTRITFDPSIIEIFLSLSSGATLVMIPDHIRSIPTKLLDIVADNNITVLQGTPSLICSFGKKAIKEILLNNESVLRVLAFGGEICPSFSKLQQWKSERNCTEIYNLYGLTEISCWATCFRIDFQTGKLLSSIPLGDPLLNTVIEIYDKNGEISDTGELQIGGPGRFCIVNNEQWPKSYDSIMRPTGDLACKTSDGFIYFEGRTDSIVKYKGHKISLQLIYNIVDTFPELENSFVHFDTLSSKLYIFIILASEISFDSEVERELIRKLRKSVLNLPAISFFPVPSFPVTKHGKVDREKLVSLLEANKVQRVSVRSTVAEKSDDIISNIWKNYTNQISIMENDNFILNGGDSLTAVQFVSDIEGHFQLSLPLLIEKILNETFKDVKQYVNLCLEDNNQSAKVILLCESNSHSLESINQPSSKKMCPDLKCFKFASKKGYFEYCFHSKNSANCFHQKAEVSQSCTLNFSLVLKWDLKKCIDATPCIFYEPQFNQHLIFIGSHFGMFSCINVNEKLEKWQILVPGRIESSACISSCGNYILFGCYDHHLYCINIADGSISWKYETGAEVKSSPTVSFNNKAFVGSHDKHVYAIDVKIGYLLWKKQVAYGSIFSSPLVIESLCAVCIGTLDGVLALLNMESGDTLWKYCFGKPLFSSPVIISNYILVGSTDNCILCLDFAGKEVFKYSTDGPVFSSAAFFNSCEKNLVLFGCHDFHVYCLTLKGHLVWKTLCDSAIYAAPLYFKLNNCLYICVASSKGTLYILEINNGKVLLSWNCPGEIFSSPVILDNILAVGCRDNNIYCFNLEV